MDQIGVDVAPGSPVTVVAGWLSQIAGLYKDPDINQAAGEGGWLTH